MVKDRIRLLVIHTTSLLALKIILIGFFNGSSQVRQPLLLVVPLLNVVVSVLTLRIVLYYRESFILLYVIGYGIVMDSYMVK